MASRKAKDAKATDNDFQFSNATPLQIWRSDGTEMPSEYSQYERVEEGAKPLIEWQNKLGQALAAELMPGATGLYFLQDFPAHYHLRWYQAAKEDKKKHQAKHYYLFGYPEEPGVNKARKYYRSPNHFLPHLLWLIGESQDNGDCACEFCSGSKPITIVLQQLYNNPPQQEAQTIAPYQASDAAPIIPQPSYPIAHDHGALFRPGEVVWYKNNNSWRVGMILTSSVTLSIIPFGHPLYPTQEVIKEEADIRPFLAFSIPQITNGLQEFKGHALAQIDWQALQERFGTHTDASRREGLAIEATKLAATRVDQCYSTFNPFGEPGQNYDVFGGVFLGAEKICVGEAVRIKLLREQQDQVAEKGMPMVMVVKRILITGESGALMFEGSLWKLQHATLTQQSQTPNQPPLPAALIGEKEFRDNILRERGWRVEWVLINQNMSVNETAIRGRFYETRRLTPILNPAKFQEMLHNRHVDDIQTLLNNRADSNGPPVGRVLNRAQAVAGAVNVLPSLGPDVIEA
ncbi:hypothetical protein NUW58_g8077 [Xylaria curta]|uniref:Uncharacterized protein n=1 Tax=Xylaria curta TaxID=42375 RepID=A0ACC1NC30_9PEZI|nr:hypothetical protein NUW58_g8077 [Xylaria curta]